MLASDLANHTTLCLVNALCRDKQRWLLTIAHWFYVPPAHGDDLFGRSQLNDESAGLPSRGVQCQ